MQAVFLLTNSHEASVDKRWEREMMQPDRDIRNWIDCHKAWTGPDAGIHKLGSAGFWNEAWKRRSGSREERPGPDDRRGRKRTEALFGLLEEAGFRADGARVLDIGCGPGALSLPLARAGAHVTSLDISSSALDCLMAEADRESLSIEPVECSWWTADIDSRGFRNRFDLVIASMTPSIRDVETFDRMAACSRKLCYYSGSLPGGRNRALQEIYTNVLGPDFPRHRDGRPLFLYYFMYLYLNRYRPIVRIHHHRQRSEVNWEEAADQMIRIIERAGNCTPVTKKKIRTYYRKSAAGGKYPVRSDGYTGMMAWDVNR
jgi:SAM-dependent methyltransferase